MGSVAHSAGAVGEGGGAGRQGERTTQRTDLAQRPSSTPAEVRRGPQRPSRQRPRCGWLPPGRDRATIVSRRERMSGLRSAARPRSAAARSAATRCWRAKIPRRSWCPAASAFLCPARAPSRATLGRSKAALCAPSSSARSAASGDLSQPTSEVVRPLLCEIKADLKGGLYRQWRRSPVALHARPGDDRARAVRTARTGTYARVPRHALCGNACRGP
jgi:hypothetical protein